MAPRSTELDIISQSLTEVVRRMEGAAQTPLVQQLASRAAEYRRVVTEWNDHPPSEGERNSLLQRVLGLHIEVLKAHIEYEDAAGDGYDRRAPDSR